MCTETFLRLPEEKRNRFLNAAWEEFTNVPFATASINQIVRRAGIPRGSFYQYFSDKSDLFAYLMEDVHIQIMDIIQDLLIRANGDVFRTMLMAFDSFLRQKNNIPLLSRCMNVLRINPGIDLEGMITGHSDEIIMKHFRPKMDLSNFRRQDEAFILRVCCLIGMCLGGALMDALSNPERGSKCREDLAEKLDIIQRGSLSPRAREEYYGEEEQSDCADAGSVAVRGIRRGRECRR